MAGLLEKTLTFQSILSQDVRLHLAFELPKLPGVTGPPELPGGPSVPGIPGAEADKNKDTAPQSIQWKVIQLSGEGLQSATVKFENVTTFSKPKNDEKPSSDDAWMLVPFGMATTLTKLPGTRVFEFTPPIPNPEGLPPLIQVANLTGEEQDIAAGFVNEKSPNPVFLFPKVKPTVPLQVPMIPILTAYITYNHNHDSINRGHTETGIIWKQELLTLPGSTTWNVTRDGLGQFHIARNEDN